MWDMGPLKHLICKLFTSNSSDLISQPAWFVFFVRWVKLIICSISKPTPDHALLLQSLYDGITFFDAFDSK